MDEKTQKPVLVERRGPILIVTINRPDAKNAVDPETAELINSAMDLLDDVDELFVGIITGAGGTFCAGADLKAVQRLKLEGKARPELPRGGFGLFRRPPRKPLIAAVEGFAFGGGMETCLACDMVVAAETAKFCLPEVKWNVAAIGGGLFRLQTRIPHNIAMEMALTGTPRSASFMERWGFVNRLVPQGKALEEALALAETLLENGPMAVYASKKIMIEARNWSTEDECWEKQTPIYEQVVNSQDTLEGLAAFREKRKPVWRGV